MEGVRKKTEVDRISSLPDILIQHIVSFLPLTKEAIRSSILSKRWKDQWTHVPVLILKPSDVSDGNFIKFTENVLLEYNSVKIEKFYDDFSAKVRFPTRRNVEELTLKCKNVFYDEFPEFIFKLASLVKLCTVNCSVIPNKRFSWECLKELRLSDCKVSELAIYSVLEGSPLEFLELRFCVGFEKLYVFSNYLKRFVVDQQNMVFEISSCPILEELTFWGARLKRMSRSSMASLKSFELCRSGNCSASISIGSESLRRLVLKEIRAFSIDISCPNLKELKLEDLKYVRTLKLNS